MNKTKKYLTLFFLATGQGAIYWLPYIRLVYYNPMLESMGVTHAEFGSLMSFFGVLTMILFIPGGIVTDKWDYKKCITLSLFSTAALVGSFAFYMTFAYARIVWLLLAVTTNFVFWPAILKAVRIISDKKEQSKTFGIFYGFQGLMSIILGNFMLFVFHRFSDPTAGLKTVIMINASVNLIAGIVCQFVLLPQSKLQLLSDGENNAFSFKLLGQVMKNPLIWLLSLMVFCAYGLYSNSYLYSTYLTTVKGLSETIGAQLSLIRVTYMMCFASMLGGLAANKLKSTTKWYTICAVGTLASTAMFMLLKDSGFNVIMLSVISILPSAFMLLVYGLSSSLYEEYGIPLGVTGTAIGVVSIIGYAPDTLFQPILGSMLDKQGDAGFQSVFSFFLVVGFVGLVASILALALNKKRCAQIAAAQAKKNIQSKEEFNVSVK